MLFGWLKPKPKMTAKQRDNLELWIMALISGEYAQNSGAYKMFEPHNGFFDIFEVAADITDTWFFDRDRQPVDFPTQPWLNETFGLKGSLLDTLEAHLVADIPFIDVAKWLVGHLPNSRNKEAIRLQINRIAKRRAKGLRDTEGVVAYA